MAVQAEQGAGHSCEMRGALHREGTYGLQGRGPGKKGTLAEQLQKDETST